MAFEDDSKILSLLPNLGVSGDKADLEALDDDLVLVILSLPSKKSLGNLLVLTLILLLRDCLLDV